MRRGLRPRLPRLIVAAGALAALASVTPLLLAQSPPAVGVREQVWIVRSDGQGLRRITDDRRFHSDPAWSRDGGRLAFTTSGRKRNVIEIFSLSGSSSRKLRISSRLGSPVEPEWSPRRNELAFSAFRELKFDIRRTVATIRDDGSRLRRLAEHPFGAVVPSGPVWSPDGDRIAFVRQRSTRPSDFPDRPLQPVPTTTGLDLVVASRNGAKRRIRLRGDELDPRWSPDGHAILFLRRGSRGRLGLWSVSPRGHRLRPIARGLITAHPAWSPDGRRIAFTGVTFSGDRHPHLYVVDPGGRAPPRQIAEAGEVAEVRPAWSPDGSLLAVVDFNGHVGLAAPDGHRLRIIATLPGAELYDVAWSPDGGWIAFTAAKRPKET